MAETFEPADYNKDGKVSKKEKAQYDKINRAAFLAMLPAQYAMLEEDPAVGEFLDRKWQEYKDNPTAFSKDAFFIEMDNLDYFKKLSKAAIADMDLERRLPDVYKQQVDAEIETLRDEAIVAGAKMSDDQLRDLVVQRRRMGLSDAQVKNALAKAVQASGSYASGQAGQLQTGIKNWAQRNGLALSDNMVNDYITKIQSGDTTENDVLQDLRNTYLAGMYPAWSDKIMAGMDPADIFAPHLKNAQDLLEDANIDLNDPIMKRITQAVGPDGKPYAIPLYEAERQIRSDPRWQKTNNAYDLYARTLNDVFSTWGIG